MKLNIIKDEKNGLGKWDVIVDAKTWKSQLAKAETKLIMQVEIPGFRKGKVPTKMAKKHVTEAQTLQQATKAIISMAYVFVLKQKPYLMPSNQPEVKVEKATNQECEIIFSFDLPPEIIIGKYRDISIAKRVVTVNQAEIDAQIKLLQDQFAIFTPKEEVESKKAKLQPEEKNDNIFFNHADAKAVEEKAKIKLEKGDVAIFNFTGFLKGKKFSGGEAKDMQLEIGSNKFIPGFEAAMIGMERGTKKMIEVTFPEDYHVPNLKGQLVKFEIELNEIKIKTINEDLAELVKDINMPGVTNTEELLASLTKQIELQKTMAMKEQFMEELIAKIVKDSKIIIPSFAVKNETERLENEFKKQLAKKNFTIENYMAATGLSHEQITKEIEKDAIMQLQNFLVVEEIIKQEKIEVTEDEIQKQLMAFSEQFKISIEEVKKNIEDLSLVTTTLKRNKVFDLLWSENGKTQK